LKARFLGRLLTRLLTRRFPRKSRRNGTECAACGPQSALPSAQPMTTIMDGSFPKASPVFAFCAPRFAWVTPEKSRTELQAVRRAYRGL